MKKGALVSKPGDKRRYLFAPDVGRGRLDRSAPEDHFGHVTGLFGILVGGPGVGCGRADSMGGPPAMSKISVPFFQVQNILHVCR